MDGTISRRVWSLEDPEVQAAKREFARNRCYRPRHAGSLDSLSFDDLFEYFSHPGHPGVRHKARALGVHWSGLLDLYNRYLRKFFGTLNRNAGPPRRKSKSAA